MFTYDFLLWFVSFRVFCPFAIWLTIGLALLVRAESGRRRRRIAREALNNLDSRGESIPAAARRASKAVLRRAVVVVGGDFARSPRMQYHATSLAHCGMFDEIVLVGFDMGNRLSESLQHPGDEASVVSTHYLVPPFKVPSWMRRVFFERRVYWAAATIYRVCAYIVVFSWIIARASVMWINESGQLLLTDVLFVQAPPTVPVVPLIKFIVRPIVFLVNLALYYGFIVPASWLMCGAFKEIRECVRLQQQLPQQRLLSRRGQRWIVRPAIVVDWHNFGYTIMRSDARPSLAVGVYWFFERYLSWGDRNITVSKAMRDELLCAHNETKGKKKTMELAKVNSTGDDVVVLYDTAPTFFGPVQRNQFVRDVLLPVIRSKTCHNPQRSNTVTGESVGIAQPPSWIIDGAMRPDDDGKECEGIFMVAATSWTADDDYSIVVEALVQLDKRLQLQQQQKQKQHQQQEQQEEEQGVGSMTRVRPLWLLVTGKGEMRKQFEEAVTAAGLSPLVTVTTLYFQSYKEYAMALGAADLGLCLHYSSSGLDLPMKAVDMLGSGLPVIAWRYDALPELLDEKRAWLFNSAKELETILWNDVLCVNTNIDSLTEKRRHVLQHRTTWDESWRLSVLPLLLELA